jgi:D-alanine-D-alanine ligase-like ATP-grasp enzyme
MKKNSTGFRPQIRSRHPSHSVLRGTLQRMPFRSVIRFGSTTQLIDSGVEINTVEAISNSASKLRMKNCFTNGNVRTAQWTVGRSLDQVNTWAAQLYPIVAKSFYGSRGRGNSLINSTTELSTWAQGKTLSNYIFEKYHNYSREYRLHVTSQGCFYTCRKMIKEGTPKHLRWFRNDSNCVWIKEDNESFDKPANWEDIVEQSVRALTACGLDFGACDVRVQSAKDDKGRARQSCDFIIVEINSAPAFGKVTEEKYREMLPTLLRNKFNSKRN